MEKAVLFINEHIGNHPFFGKGFMFGDLLEFLFKNEDAKSYEIHINSPGGSVEEGFQIANHIEGLEKPVTMIGQRVESIATVIFLAGDERIVYPDTEFMIHNPWVSIDGNADELESVIPELREIEEQTIAFYQERTQADNTLLRELMSAETYLSTDQLLKLGFATEILKLVDSVEADQPTEDLIQAHKADRIKAFAFIREESKSKTKDNMTKVETMLKGLTDKVNAIMSSKNKVQIALESGKVLDIHQSGESLAEGDQVFIENQAPEDGQYIAAQTNQIFNISGGVIASIEEKEIEQPEFTAENVKELVEGAVLAMAEMFKDQQEKQTVAITELTIQLSTMKSDHETVKADLEKAKANTNTKYMAPRPTEPTAGGTKAESPPAPTFVENAMEKRKREIREKNGQ